MSNEADNEKFLIPELEKEMEMKDEEKALREKASRDLRASEIIYKKIMDQLLEVKNYFNSKDLNSVVKDQ